MNFRRLFALFLSLIALGSASAKEIKCATVNIHQLITDYHTAKKEISSLQEKKKEYAKKHTKKAKNIANLESKIKTLLAEIRNPTTPETKRITLTTDYEKLISRYNILRKEPNQSDLTQVHEIETKIAKVTRKYLDEIHSVISQYAKDNQYQWIIDTSGFTNTQISPLVYARETTDITPEILAILNKDAPKEKDDDE